MSFGPGPRGLGPQYDDDNGDGDRGGVHPREDKRGPEPKGPGPRGNMEGQVVVMVMVVTWGGDNDDGDHVCPCTYVMCV